MHAITVTVASLFT